MSSSIIAKRIVLLILYLSLPRGLSVTSASAWLDGQLKTGAQSNSNPTLLSNTNGKQVSESFFHFDPSLLFKTHIGEVEMDFLSQARVFWGKLLVPRSVPEFEEKIRLDVSINGLKYYANGSFQLKYETDWDLFLLDLKTQVLDFEQSLKSASSSGSYYWQMGARLLNKDYLYGKISNYNYLQGIIDMRHFFRMSDEQIIQFAALWNSRVYPVIKGTHLLNISYPVFLLGLDSQLSRGNKLKIMAGYNFFSALGQYENGVNPFQISLEINTQKIADNQNFYAKLSFYPSYHHLDLLSQSLEILVGMSSIYFDRFQLDLVGKIKQQQLPNRIKGIDTLIGGQMELKYFVTLHWQWGLFFAVQSVFSSIERNKSPVNSDNFLSEYPFILSSQGINFTGNAYAQFTF